MPGLIEVLGVVKIYKMGDVDFHAIRGISLSIDSGEFVALMGPSGSGKSTFMNILGCLDIPTSGKYFLEQQDISHLSKDNLAVIRNKKIGFVFQSFNLLSKVSAIENVGLPLLYNGSPSKVRRERSILVLKSVGLGGKEHHRPNQLSGGEQQRVAIARALVNNPSLILADEPTGNLDSQTSVELMMLFKRLNKENGITIVMVTHEPDIARYADRRVYFKDGRIVKDDKQ
ncbi:MAG: macrolide ABC transporter ATP-binding protein [Deltaproteobacteria bacterium RBG_16_42_7]|nr:MAG: macrolide ABC transporter ATP-binding protein [Deltaproteobacteria bacterium RBG_16_42_7]